MTNKLSDFGRSGRPNRKQPNKEKEEAPSPKKKRQPRSPEYVVTDSEDVSDTASVISAVESDSDTEKEDADQQSSDMQEEGSKRPSIGGK